MPLFSARVLLLLLSLSSLVVAVADFAQCLEDFKNDPNAVGGVDSRGHPTSPAEAVGLTYKVCAARCGTDAEVFEWRQFVQLFSSWLLPWLALLSQLPFGSGNYTDDFLSIVISVGSPALAAYSLALTSLNAQLVYRRAQHIKHESKTAVARALISLQQIPLELTKDERLLAFIPINDQWRREIIDRLNQRNAWSIATGSSIAWVVIAFVFTLVDSFISLSNLSGGEFEGLAVCTLWLWLLCLVIGWLWVPTFTCGELNSAISHANRKAAKRFRRKASKAYNSAKTRITNRFPKGMPILKGSKKPVADPIPGEDEKVEEESIQEDIKDVGQETEPKADLISNSAHHQSTVSFQMPPEGQQGHDHFSISTIATANQSVVTVTCSTDGLSITQSSIHPETDRLLIPKDTFGSLNRDELRLAATFNYSRIMRYLVLVDDVLRALDELTREKDKKKRPIPESTATLPTEDVVFPRGALISMFKASIFALILQCGTTAAAVIIIIFTPTVGLGCRSLGYLLYGGNAIIIMFLTIISTISARISETRNERSPTVKSFTASIAIALRRISLFLAFTNATGLVVLSCLQFSRLLDSCYCNASVIGRGTDSYIIFYYQGWIPTVRNSRIPATIIAAVSMTIYMVFLWFVNALPAEIDYL